MFKITGLNGSLATRLAITVLLFGMCMPSRSEEVRYVYTDSQNTVLAMTDTAGVIIIDRAYEPFGTPTEVSTVDGPGYTGHVEDPESDLVYMQARFYDPALARFLSTDPVLPAAGDVFLINRYAYVQNNPISHTDPTGMMTCSESGEVSPGVQRMRNASDKCTSNGDSGTTAPIALGGSLIDVLAVAAARTTVIVSVLSLAGDTPGKRDDRFVYVTYVRTSIDGRLRYSGRTSGTIKISDPIPGLTRIVQIRNQQQPILNAEGYGPGVVDKWSTDYYAIRGREQQLIDFWGGARSMGGTSRNMINGIAPGNLLREFYMNSSNKEFGPLPNNAPPAR